MEYEKRRYSRKFRSDERMKLHIPYGRSSMRLEVGDARRIDVVSPREISPDDDAVANSLRRPVNSSELSEFLLNRDKILVVINDYTRPTRTAEVLPALDLKDKKVGTIIASGAHRASSQSELEKLVGGAAPPYGGKVIVHDAKNDSQLRSLGHTTRGTDLQISEQLFDADGIIVVGSVEPHYYAGFTGGRKFCLPGLAGYKSIEMNHALVLDERSSILRLGGNPVHEDFMNALELYDRYEDIFSIQLVLNRDHQISYALSGHIVDSFNEAVERAKEIYVAPVESKADIVIAVATSPMDVDLYQAHKAIENVKPALNDEGVLILVSACPDGIGPRGFYDLLASGGDVLEKIGEGYRLGYHKAAKLIQLEKRAKLFAVTDLQPSILNAVSIAPYSDIQSAFDAATELKGSNSQVVVVLDGCLTVPVPRK
jgi:nickel-dependent lactate racemase